jgi:uncharacterized repeat protein (TIGR04076 family)
MTFCPNIRHAQAGNPAVVVSCCTDGLRPVFFRFGAVPLSRRRTGDRDI